MAFTGSLVSSSVLTNNSPIGQDDDVLAIRQGHYPWERTLRKRVVRVKASANSIDLTERVVGVEAPTNSVGLAKRVVGVEASTNPVDLVKGVVGVEITPNAIKFAKWVIRV